MYGIVYNNKHSFREFGLTMLSQREMQPPAKKKITVTVPFMSGSYDFSNLYNSSHFEERTLEYRFLTKVANVEALEAKKIAIENWLLNGNQKTVLKDDTLKGYYYLAECTNVQVEEMHTIGKIKALFTAYPFKICEDYEGKLLWDNFNFELDVLQETKFQVKEEKEVTLYNQGVISVTPTIICNAPFNIEKNGTIYKVSEGTVNDCQLKFEPGMNKLIIQGEGDIEFQFRKEVL